MLGRRAAGDLRRRRRLALQLRARGRRQGQRQAALEVRLQSQGRRSTSVGGRGHAQPHHRHAGDLRRPGLRRRRRGPRARRRRRPPVVHRSDQARRRQPGAGLQRQGSQRRRSRTSGCRPSSTEEGDFARPNPNSAVVWHYAEYDRNGDGKIDFEETMHRTSAPSPSRTTSCTSPTSAACSTASMPRPAKPHWTLRHAGRRAGARR